MCAKNRNQIQAEYAIITSFKAKDKDTFYGKFRHLLYFGTKYLLYALSLNRPKMQKYKDKYMGVWHAREHYTCLGHRGMLMSLFRGFEELKIPYTYNQITKSTKNVILLWCDRKDLVYVEKLKKRNLIQKVVTGPTACKHDDYMQYVFPEYDCIDRVLVGSNVYKQKNFVPRVKPELINKVVAWPSGVILQDKPANKIQKTCICYYKYVKPNAELHKTITNMGIKCIDVCYGSYSIDDWYTWLQTVDFVIFNQDITETQGLAFAEAWASNRPTFIKTRDKTGIYRTSPYLTDQCGKFFTDMDELTDILKQYCAAPAEFLSQFGPRQWVMNNMTDRVSVQKLIDIFDSIKT